MRRGNGDDYSLLADAHLHNEQRPVRGKRVNKRIVNKPFLRGDSEHVMRMRGEEWAAMLFHMSRISEISFVSRVDDIRDHYDIPILKSTVSR
jgi:hypothetical protein